MTDIVVTDEQAQVIVNSTDEVLIRDQNGNVLGRIVSEPSPDDAAILDEAKRRLASDQPRYTTRQVLDHLKSLKSSESQ